MIVRMSDEIADKLGAPLVPQWAIEGFRQHNLFPAVPAHLMVLTHEGKLRMWADQRPMDEVLGRR